MPESVTRSILFRGKRGQVVIALLLGILGFAAVTQVRTNSDETNYSAYRVQDLVDLLGALDTANQQKQKQITQLEQQKQTLLQGTNDRKAALDQATKETNDLKILAGTVPARGPGIVVTITDSANAVDVSSLLDLIEELRSAGAEAMSVNDQVRIVADSAIDRTDSGITIDGIQLHAPYVLSAIGDATTLNGAVTFARGPKFELESKGAIVDVAQKPQVDVRPVVTR